MGAGMLIEDRAFTGAAWHAVKIHYQPPRSIPVFKQLHGRGVRH